MYIKKKINQPGDSWIRRLNGFLVIFKIDREGYFTHIWVDAPLNEPLLYKNHFLIDPELILGTNFRKYVSGRDAEQLDTQIKAALRTGQTGYVIYTVHVSRRTARRAAAIQKYDDHSVLIFHRPF